MALETWFTGSVLAAAGAALAVGVPGISSARGLEFSGHAAAGVTAEDEKKFGVVMVFQALPQTQSIYGFVVSILILLGILGGNMTPEKGLVCVMAGVAVALTSISAINQGKLAASAIGAVAKNSNVRGKVLIFVITTEIAALLGFTIAILLLISGKVF